MTTYNSYEAAKIANPERAIYKIGDNFTELSELLGQPLQPCNPADHCMTVDKFLYDGHEFVEGDIYLNSDGRTLGVVNIPEYNNKRSTIDCSLYILRAAALENQMNIDKVETQTPEEKESNSDYCERMFWEYDKELLGRDSTRMLFKKYLSLAIIFGKNETQTEHQEAMSAFSGEVEWLSVGAIVSTNYGDGEVLTEAFVDGYSKWLVQFKDTYRAFDEKDLSKPETPQQREERERLEAAEDLYYTYMSQWEFCQRWSVLDKNNQDAFLAIVDKTNYRKEK